MLIITATICFIVWLLVKHRIYFRSILLAFQLSGPPALPIVGNIFDIKDINGFLTKLKNPSKTPVIRTWLGFVPLFLIYEPDHLKIILSSTKVSEKNFIYKLTESIAGRGLLTMTGAKWKQNRRLVQQLFQNNFLETYCYTFTESSKKMVDDLSGRTSVNMTTVINNCVMSTLHKIVLGVDLEDVEDTPFAKFDCFIVQRLLKPWLLLESIFTYSSMSTNEHMQISNCHAYVNKMLNQRLAKITTHGDSTPCFLNWFIQFWKNNEMTKEEIVNETVSFLLVGFDSVATQTTFCLYFLAKYPNIQDTVYKEIAEATEGISFDKLTAKELNKMHYLENCIKETLRLVPTVPILLRELTTDVTLGNIKLHTGYQILVMPTVTQTLSHVFADPLKFDPDRFLPKNFKDVPPYGYIPFSQGPRICIGNKFAILEMKTIIAFLVKNYYLELKDPSQEINLSYKMTLRLKGGLWLNISPRTSSTASS